MRNRLSCATLLVLLTIACANVRAETLELKDGTKVVGSVVSETDSDITLKVKFGTITYQRSDIKSIEKDGDIPAQAPAPKAAAPKPDVAKPAEPKPTPEIKPKTETVAAPPKPAAPPPEPPAPKAAKPKDPDAVVSKPAPQPPPSGITPSGAKPHEDNEPRDVVVLKAGGEQRGFLISESDEEVVFDVIMSGRNVAKTILSRTTFRRAEVDSIKKLTDEERAAALKSLANVAEEAKKDKAAEQNLDIEYVQVPTDDPKKTATLKRVQLEHFTIESDVDDDLLRKLAFRLDKVFNAYKQHFGVDRNDTVKIRVVIFHSMAEYYAAIGNSMKNPAFYAPQKKLIYAGCDVEQYEALIKEIREHHKKLDTELKEWKLNVEQARADVRQQVSRAYDQINAGGKGATAAGQAAMENIKQQEREWQLDIAQKEKHVNEIQDLIFQLNRRNDVVFTQVMQQMLATMYHEGFHAFLDNFLFTSEQVEAVPRWLNEGLAQYFEAARLENGRFILGQDVREKMVILKKFRNEASLLPLEKILNGGQMDYMVHEISNLEHSTKNYLQAWILTNTLGEKGRLKKEILQAYVTALVDKKKPVDALPVLSGMPNDQVEQAIEDKLKPGFQAAPAPEK
jgi:hypothetical protein